MTVTATSNMLEWFDQIHRDTGDVWDAISKMASGALGSTYKSNQGKLWTVVGTK